MQATCYSEDRRIGEHPSCPLSLLRTFQKQKTRMGEGWGEGKSLWEHIRVWHVNNEGRDPDFVEKELSKFETRVANAMRSVHYVNKFEGEDRVLIHEFIAMIAARKPPSRQKISSFLGHLCRATLRGMLRDNSELKQMRIAQLRELKTEKGLQK